MAAEYRIYIVASDGLARAGLAALLLGQAGCQVVGQGAPGPELAESLRPFQPDALLWDVGWSGGSSAVQMAALTGPSSPPIAALLTDEAQAAAAWDGGARALLLRDTPAPRLVAALAALIEGFAVIDPALAPRLRPLRPEGSGAEALTPRELEVLRLLAEGLANKAIAGRLAISEHTVKFHVNAILGKLGVQSRTEAVVQATRLGLVLL